MSADIVNLRLARKRKVRSERDRRAEDNRQKFGLTKAQRQTAAHEKMTLDRIVENHRLVSSETEEPDDASDPE